MTAQDQIHNQFVTGVRSAVNKLEAARRIYPPAYVESVIMPRHERTLDGLLAWRVNQLSQIGAFSALPSRGNSAQSKQLPPNVSKAINTAYQAQLATINATFQQKEATLKAQTDAVVKDAEAKLKQAKHLKDTNSQKQLNQAIKAAKQAYKDQVKQFNAQKQQAIASLTANITAQLNQAAAGTVVLPPVSGGGTGSGGAGGASTGTQYPIFDSNGNFIGYTTTPPPTSSIPNYTQNQNYPPSSYPQDPGAGGPSTANQPQVSTSNVPQIVNGILYVAQYDGSGNFAGYAPDPNQDPSHISQVISYYAANGIRIPNDGSIQVAGASSGSILDDLFGFINQLLGGPAPTGSPATSIAPITTPTPGNQVVATPVNSVVTPYNQPLAGLPTPTAPAELDIFGNDPWGGGNFGEFVAGPIMGNRAIARLNRMSVLPRSSFGYGQWASIISGVIQAAGSVGSAVATAELAPKPGKTTQVVAPPAAAPVAPSTNYTPWLLGGGVALGLLAVGMVVSKRR